MSQADSREEQESRDILPPGLEQAPPEEHGGSLSDWKGYAPEILLALDE